MVAPAFFRPCTGPERADAAAQGATPMAARIRAFAGDTSGASSIEYGLIVSLIALAVVAGASSMGDEIGNLFNRIGNFMKNKAT